MAWDGTEILRRIQDFLTLNDATQQRISDFFRMDNPGLQLGLDLAGVALPLVLLALLAGLPVLCLAGQIQGRTRKRSFYDKCARQLAGLTMGLGWLAVALGLGILYARMGMPSTFVWPPLTELCCWLLTAGTALGATLYALLWRPLRSWPLAHGLLGALALACGWAALYLALLVVESDALSIQGMERAVTLATLWIPANAAALGAVAVYLPPLSLGLAGGAAAFWLVLRRHRDDYGRDHYNLMLPWCARWARNAWLVLWLALLAGSAQSLYALWQMQGSLPPQVFIEPVARLLLWSLPALLWTPVLRSAVPLRHKFSLLLGLLVGMGFLVPVYMELVAAL